MSIKRGNHVRWLCPDGYYIYGEVTIIKNDMAKVLFDGNFDWNYDYYPIKDLELMKPEDLEDKNG